MQAWGEWPTNNSRHHRFMVRAAVLLEEDDVFDDPLQLNVSGALFTAHALQHHFPRLQHIYTTGPLGCKRLGFDRLKRVSCRRGGFVYQNDPAPERMRVCYLQLSMRKHNDNWYAQDHITQITQLVTCDTFQYKHIYFKSYARERELREMQFRRLVATNYFEWPDDEVAWYAPHSQIEYNGAQRFFSCAYREGGFTINVQHNDEKQFRRDLQKAEADDLALEPLEEFWDWNYSYTGKPKWTKYKLYKPEA